MKELPIPVAFAAAFEGEIIRKAVMHNECWSSKNPTTDCEELYGWLTEKNHPVLSMEPLM